MSDILNTESKKYYAKIGNIVRNIAVAAKLILVGEKVLFLMVFLSLEFLLGIFLDNIFHFDFAFRLLFFILLSGTVLFIAVYKILFLFKKSISADEAALLIEEKFVHLNNILINALQLGRQTAVSSTEIVNLLITDAFLKVQKLRVYSALRFRIFLKYVMLNFALAVSLSLYAYFFPDYFKNGLLRILNPFSNLAPLLRTKIEIFPPGDIFVLNGEAAEIKIVTFGKAVKEAIIYYQIKGEKKAFSAMVQNEPVQFSYQFKKILKPIDYYIKAGDARSKVHTIHVVYPPVVTGIDFTIKYPEYTGLNPEEIRNSSGNLSVLYGSEVKVKVGSNKKHSEMSKATLSFLDRDMEQSFNLVKEKEQEVLVTTFSAENTLSYKINLKDSLGYKNLRGIVYTVEVVEDSPPQISLESLNDNIKVGEEAEINIRVLVRDDYGIEKIVLKYSVNSSEEKAVVLYESAHKENLKEVSLNYDWDLAELNFREGDSVKYHLVAYDNDTLKGPKKIATKQYTISIMDLYDKREIILREMQEYLRTIKKAFVSQLVVKYSMEQYTAKNLKKIKQKEIEQVLSRQQEINKKIKDLEHSLSILKEKEKAHEAIKNQLTLCWLPLQALLQEDIYSYEVELERIFAEERIKDKEIILQEIVAWQGNFGRKLLQLWERMVAVYSELKRKNILYKLKRAIKEEEELKNELKQFLGKKITKPEGELIKKILSRQRFLTTDIKEFAANLEKDVKAVRINILKSNIGDIMEKISQDFFKKELVFSHLGKISGALKGNKIEDAVKNATIVINKLKKILLEVNLPWLKESEQRIKSLLDFIADMDKKIDRLLEIEKGFLVYLSKKKFSKSENFFIREVKYHTKLNNIISFMVKEINEKRKQETSRFKRGVRYLQEVNSDKQEEIEALKKQAVPTAIFFAKSIIQKLKESKKYFTKFKEKIERVEKEKVKSGEREEKKDKGVPQINIISPGKDIVVLPNAEVPIVVEARDDYGLSSIDFIYQIFPVSKEQVINLAEYKEVKEKTKEEYKFVIKKLGLRDKTTITYYAQAIDEDLFKKNVGKSKTYQISVIPADYLSSKEEEVKREDKMYQEIKDLVKEILLVTFNEQLKISEEIAHIKKRKSFLKEGLKERYDVLIQRQKLLKEEISAVLDIIDNIDTEQKGKKVTYFLNRVKFILQEVGKKDMQEVINTLKDFVH